MGRLAWWLLAFLHSVPPYLNQVLPPAADLSHETLELCFVVRHFHDVVLRILLEDVQSSFLGKRRWLHSGDVTSLRQEICIPSETVTIWQSDYNCLTDCVVS